MNSNEIIYVIELDTNCWFSGSWQESREVDPKRTVVIRNANFYQIEQTAQNNCRNIVNASRFKNAKVVSYSIKKLTETTSEVLDKRDLLDHIFGKCGECETDVRDDQRYCYRCGRELQWEEKR